MSYRNHEGYSDPTAGEAIANVMREHQRKLLAVRSRNLHGKERRQQKCKKKEKHGGTVLPRNITETMEVEKMGKETTLIPCVDADRYAGCFACKDRLCDCLQENDFPQKKCPFYKTVAEAEHSNVAALGRLIQIDRVDLIRKYGSHRFLSKGGKADAGCNTV